MLALLFYANFKSRKPVGLKELSNVHWVMAADIEIDIVHLLVKFWGTWWRRDLMT